MLRHSDVREPRVRPGGDKGTSTPPAVSLPKGGGAIRGIGEKFGVNPSNGTASMTVPVFTSPGRSGFHPQLSIDYNSGAGNGPFGFGWHLSIPSVTRKTDKGLPRYFDSEDSDVFILSDAEDLVPVLSLQNGKWLPAPASDGAWNGETFSVRRYRPRVEGLFARIEQWRHKLSGDIHWRAITRDNVTSIYGLHSGCRIADPEDSARVFNWLLETTFDDKGSVIFYEYKPEDQTGVMPQAANERNRRNGNAPYTNLYIKRIHYGNRSPYGRGEDLSKRTDWLFEVVFDYGEHSLTRPAPTEDPSLRWATRADPFSSFRSTFDIRTYRLCRRVLMFHHFPEGSNGETGYDGIVRSTDFTYDRQGPASPLIGNPVATKLLSVTQTGYAPGSGGGDLVSDSFPPVEFEYTEPEIDPTVRIVDPASLENLPIGADGMDYQLLDLDGEGLPGIVAQQGGALFYKRNLSPLDITTENGTSQSLARFGPVELADPQPASVADGTVPCFMDLSAGGRQDLVELDGPSRGYYERTDTEGWEDMTEFRSFPNLDMRDPNLKFIDINGDGLADILVSEDQAMAWYKSLAHEGFGSRESSAKPYDEERGPALVFSDPTQSIFLADMTGDGLSDIVRIRNGEVCYWPNRGYGRFGAKVTMDDSPAFDNPDIFDTRRIRPADVDGSGTTDIIYLSERGVDIYYNRSGNSWSAGKLLSDFPAIDDVASVRTADLLGNGTACLVWSSRLQPDAGRQMRYVDLMGGRKPHLLVGMKNNLGAETRVRYASSAKFYVRDREAGTPWVTRLPFPVQVVERCEVFDYIGRTRLVTTYSYRHGYFDGIEREFRGFGYVEQHDAESFGESASLFTEDTDREADALHVPPAVTKTWFHTGAWPDGETISLHMAHEYFSSSAEGPLLPDTIFPADILEVDPAQPAGKRVPYTLTGEEQREAVRALKGNILRQEIYADDGTAKAGIPYSVSERDYTLECFQPQGDNPYAVFFTQARETIDYHHERNTADPRVSHSAVLKSDPFGNFLQTVSAAYGRNLNAPGVNLAPAQAPGASPDLAVDASAFAQPEQTVALITLDENTFTAEIDRVDAYRTPMASEGCTYELTRPARADDSVVYSFDELQSMADAAVRIPYEAKPNPAAVQKRLIEDNRTLYLKDDLSGPMPPGQMDTLGLVYEGYRLAMTHNLADQVFVTNNSNPNKPDSAGLDDILSGVGSTNGSGEYVNSGGGYVHSQGDTDWWIPSGRILYSPVPPNPASPFIQDPAFAASDFYLPQAHLDLFGQFTRLTYDSYNILLKKTEDAVGNSVTAQGDYRVLQPYAVTDPNGNQTEVRFDTLGMVVGTAVEGKVAGSGSTESGDSFSSFTADLPQSEIDGFIGSQNPVNAAPSLLGTATERIIYDLQRFRKSVADSPDDPTKWEPIFAATVARETHIADIPDGGKSEFQVGFSYSDGFGRVIQRKVQAEPGPLDPGNQASPVVTPRWVGSGWVVMNNKGKPVRRYEPFFSATHDFEFAKKAGVTPTIFYDPLERVIATLHPNHTWEKVVFDPWLQRTWDVNDTVLMDPTTDPDVGDLFSLLPAPDCLPTWYQQRTGPAAGIIWTDPESLHEQQDAAQKAAAHNDTPTAGLFDVLGRMFLSVANNRYENGASTVDEYYQTRDVLDIEGNRLSVADPLGRTVVHYDYDMLKRRLHQSSMEAGERRTLSSATGQPVRTWDKRGFMRTAGYDELGRQIAFNVTGNGLIDILTEKTVYGDAKVGGPQTPELTNLRGRVYRSFDAAGVVTNTGINPSTNRNEGYDFKGNLLRSSRALLTGDAYRSAADWNLNPPTGEVFTGSSRYDALSRVIQHVDPHSTQQGASLNVTQPVYNEANLLESIDVWLDEAGEPNGMLDPGTASLHTVTNIDYDAKGLRTRIEYGIPDAGQKSQVNTAYQYDTETFRLTNLTTTRATDGTLLQDLKYFYDPAGNITHVQDDAQDTVYFSNKKVEPSGDYTYDAIYRLVKASGREHLGQTNGASNPPVPQSYNDWPNINLPYPGDGRAMGTYFEYFNYDPVGNISRVRHAGTDPANPGWTRDYTYAEASTLEPARVSNRLTSTKVGTTTETYSTSGNGYDAHGNMLHMPQLQTMEWDFKDQLQTTQRQAVNASDGDGTKHQGERTFYVYDFSGRRIRKVTETSGGIMMKERIYLGGVEIYREYTGPYAGLERQTLHVMDDKQRVAMIETRNGVDDGTAPKLVRFQFGNYLGSAVLELDDKGEVISYEEYYPYGSTAYQAMNGSIKAAARRYRYTGKERDEESGLYYHGARYYAPWLGRWTACDPIGLVDGCNLYQYSSDNPINLYDPHGTQGKPPKIKLNDVIRYGEKIENRASIGKNVQKDHIIAQEKIRMMRTDPSGKVHYLPNEDPAVVVETGKATADSAAKPHTLKTFHDAEADVKEIKRLKEGGFEHFTSDIVEPSRNAAVRSGMKAESVDKAVWGQLDRLHSSQSLEDTAKELKQLEEASKLQKAEEAAKAASVISEGTKAEKVLAAVSKVAAPVAKALKPLAPVAEVAGKVAGPLGVGLSAVQLATAKTQSQKVDASISLVGNALLASDNPVAMAGGGGVLAGQYLNHKFNVSDYAAGYGVDSEEFLKRHGVNSKVAYVTGAVVSVVSTPVALGAGVVSKIRHWL